MAKVVYPGSFDPITYGHLDLIERATDIFDHLHVAVVENPSKDPLLTATTRKQLIEQVVEDRSSTTVGRFEGLLVDYVQDQEANVILRGLRALSDFEYEFQMSMMNKRLAKDVETVYMMTGEQHSFLSSSLVREVASLGGEIDTVVPPPVERCLKEKFDLEFS